MMNEGDFCYLYLNGSTMWWLKFSLLIAVTVGVTWLIVWLDSSFKRRAKADPMASKQQGVFRSVTYLILNLRDLF